MAKPWVMTWQTPDLPQRDGLKQKRRHVVAMADVAGNSCLGPPFSPSHSAGDHVKLSDHPILTSSCLPLFARLSMFMFVTSTDY